MADAEWWKRLSFLDNPIWQGVGAIVGVAALAVAAIPLLNGNDEADRNVSEASTSSSVTGSFAPTTQDETSSTTQRITTTTVATTTSTTAAPTPFVAGSTTLPNVLRGTWGGTVNEAGASENYEVTVTFQPGPGSDVGTIEYPDYECSGFLRLEEVEADSITVVEYITEGGGPFGCQDGARNFRYLNETQIFYSFGEDMEGQATLTRR